MKLKKERGRAHAKECEEDFRISEEDSSYSDPKYFWHPVKNNFKV